MLRKAARVVPYSILPADYLYGSDNDIAQAYCLLDMPKEGRRVVSLLWTKSAQYLRYSLSLAPRNFSLMRQECERHFLLMQQMVQTASMIDRAWAEQLTQELAGYYQQYTGRQQGLNNQPM